MNAPAPVPYSRETGLPLSHTQVEGMDDMLAYGTEPRIMHPTIAVDAAVPNLLMVFPGTTLSQAQRELVLVTMRHVGERKLLAADLLGISYQALCTLLDRYRAEDERINSSSTAAR